MMVTAAHGAAGVPNEVLSLQVHPAPCRLSCIHDRRRAGMDEAAWRLLGRVARPRTDRRPWSGDGSKWRLWLVAIPDRRRPGHQGDNLTRPHLEKWRRPLRTSPHAS